MPIRSWLSLLTLAGVLFAGPARPANAAPREPPVFGPARIISQTAEPSTVPRLHLTANGTLVVVWREGAVVNAEAAMRRSTDGGATFSPYQKVSTTAGPIYFPSVGSDPLGNLFLAWREPLFPQGEVFFSRSTDDGGNFSTARNVSNTEGSTARADLAVGGSGNVYLAWDDNGQVAFSRSLDMGQTFTAPIGFTTENGFALEAAVAARGSGEVVVAWEELGEDLFQVLFVRSSDGGATWSRPRNLSQSPMDATVPRIRIGADGSLFAVYEQRDFDGNRNTAFRRVFRAASRFGARDRLSETRFLGRGGEPDLAVDDAGSVFAVWNDSGEIFFSWSPDAGGAFSVPVNLSRTPGSPVPNAPGYSSSPSVIVNPRGDVFVAWQEVLPNGNQEIVLSRAVR